MRSVLRHTRLMVFELLTKPFGNPAAFISAFRAQILHSMNPGALGTFSSQYKSYQMVNTIGAFIYKIASW